MDIEKLKEEMKDCVCGNCKLRDVAVCEACQIDFEEAANQILSKLQPYIEQAKEEERDRITKLIKTHTHTLIQPITLFEGECKALENKFWQALQNKEAD